MGLKKWIIAFIPPQPPICSHKKRNDKLNTYKTLYISTHNTHRAREFVIKSTFEMRCGCSVSFLKTGLGKSYPTKESSQTGIFCRVVKKEEGLEST